MEVWDLLRPSLRRLTVLAVAAVVAALGAVLVEHASAAQYEGRVSIYFAQALGLDTTSNSVDPTADQLTSVLQLPSVEAKAAMGGVPLNVVHDATLAHTSGSPILDITVKGSRDQATKAAPALAAAGLEYLAQQGVARAQSVQASATANLATINAELATYTASAGVQDVDAAVATAAAAAASAPSGSTGAKAAAGNLARLQALQPQYDLLTTEVQGARASVAQAYSAVGAAQGVAKAVELPGNVVTAPVTPASRITAYLRAAVGAFVVVTIFGGALLAAIELRRRRSGGRLASAPVAIAARVTPEPSAVTDTSPGIPERPSGPAVLGGDFPLLASPAASAPAEQPDRDSQPVCPEAPLATSRYFSQAQRYVRDQHQYADAAEEAKDQERERRALRDALQRVERAAAHASPPATPGAADDPGPDGAPTAPEDSAIAPIHPMFGGRAHAQIRVMKSVPAPVDDRSDSQTGTSS